MIKNIDEIFAEAKKLRKMGLAYKNIAEALYNMSGVTFSGTTVKHWLSDAESVAPTEMIKYLQDHQNHPVDVVDKHDTTA